MEKLSFRFKPQYYQTIIGSILFFLMIIFFSNVLIPNFLVVSILIGIMFNYILSTIFLYEVLIENNEIVVNYITINKKLIIKINEIKKIERLYQNSTYVLSIYYNKNRKFKIRNDVSFTFFLKNNYKFDDLIQILINRGVKFYDRGNGMSL